MDGMQCSGCSGMHRKCSKIQDLERSRLVATTIICDNPTEVPINGNSSSTRKKQMFDVFSLFVANWALAYCSNMVVCEYWFQWDDSMNFSPAKNLDLARDKKF